MNDKDVPDQLIAKLYRILRIRMIEEAIAARYPEGKMRCPTHLSIGQEAVAVMVCDNLLSTDLVVSTHRAHAHYLAKGGSLPRLIAELYGKETGCTKGRGGSMNLSDLNAGFVASTAIVANTVPVGVGLAFSQKLKKEGGITCVFLGDAAVEEGVVYESLNFAALKKLPVIFICENNSYSVNTHINLRQPAGRPIHELVKGIGLQSKFLDGNDVLNSFNQVAEVINDLRSNSGPWFLELQTYRYKIHCGPEDDNHLDRSKEELNFWLSKDPLLQLELYLIKKGHLVDDQIQSMKDQVQLEINEAFEAAEKASFPEAEMRFYYKYADSNQEWLENQLQENTEALSHE